MLDAECLDLLCWNILYSKPGGWKMAFIDSKYNWLMVYIHTLIYDYWYNAIKKELYFMFHKFQEKILNQEDGN